MIVYDRPTYAPVLPGVFVSLRTCIYSCIVIRWYYAGIYRRQASCCVIAIRIEIVVGHYGTCLARICTHPLTQLSAALRAKATSWVTTGLFGAQSVPGQPHPASELSGRWVQPWGWVANKVGLHPRSKNQHDRNVNKFPFANLLHACAAAWKWTQISALH
jgi:hypothetical protein